MWRVGDGICINVWGDSWLLSTSSENIQSPIKNIHVDDKVQILIDESSGRCKENLVYETFNAEEALVICSIPLSKWKVEDKCIWGPFHRSIFLVRSVYYLAQSVMYQVRGEP